MLFERGKDMLNPNQIEETYKEFTGNLQSLAHDGIIPIDMKFLHDQGILSSLQHEHADADDLTQYFHVIESIEKVTLFNEQFIVWIIPKMEEQQPFTLVLIALNHEEKPNLEIVFSTHGVYNTPRYVLKVLQHYLADVLETEETLTLFEKGE
jgi:hypothetical protein